MATKSIAIDVEMAQLDQALEKANRLVELLREASNIISSFSSGRETSC